MYLGRSAVFAPQAFHFEMDIFSGFFPPPDTIYIAEEILDKNWHIF